MKKRYLYMSSFFLVGTLLIVLCYNSYQSYDSKQSQKQKEQVNTVDTIKELRVNGNMKYIIESYDDATGILTSEEYAVPAELAGLTREELIKHLSQYNEIMEIQEQTDKPSCKELISFSAEKVVVRETYLGAEEETGFYLKISGGELVIYHNDKTTVYEKTGIMEENIPEDEKEKLLAGCHVEDEKELYSILENLSS